MRRAPIGALVALCACATPTTTWRPATGAIRSSAGFSLRLPPGWMVLSRGPSSTNGFIAASRDGPGLQCIAAGVTALGPEGSPALNALAAWQRLPLYGSGGSGSGRALFIVSSSLGGEASPPEVVAFSGVPVAGLPGFRAEMAFVDPRGMPVRALVLGAISGDWVYWILYAAPARHYYELDLPTFEDVATTFRVGPLPRPPTEPPP
ncbi:MAG TPA: hypothetical protein VMT17_11665 [Anaeromyxobacteraceae bacterium]|nr:hypothetical protein [Anaeromyxobacteraceae bacterium]